jgi:hypothetical protein
MHCLERDAYTSFFSCAIVRKGQSVKQNARNAHNMQVSQTRSATEGDAISGWEICCCAGSLCGSRFCVLVGMPAA